MSEVFDWAVAKLPNEPTEKITWVVYNDDHIEKTKQLIDEIKGDGYCKKYCNVVSRTSANREDRQVYYDPRLLNHIGNGAN